MDFEILGAITEIQIIAVNLSIRELSTLKEKYGGKRWRKMKGVADVRLPNGNIRKAELHWYEAHGIGKRKVKIKRFLD
ncbi:MAG: hypothetical protein HY289_00790 [Planctomycetes bacterium]|nr:hypothetical protein [Planctomycetota bacterium]